MTTPLRPGDILRSGRSSPEPRHLRSFMAVAEERHFGRAAARLNVAQPTLSRRIRQLEQQLGAELFDRGAQPISLTAAGAAFLGQAQIALRHGVLALEHARRAARGELGQLSLGAISWANSAIVPAALLVFGARAPGVSVDLHTTAPTAQVEALHEERLDVGFSAFARWLETKPGLALEPLIEEPLVAIVPASHPLAQRSEVALAELAEERFLCLSDIVAPGLVDKQIAVFHERGLSPARVQGVPDPWALLSLIAGGMGVGLHMASFSNTRYRGLAFIPLAGDAPTATLFMLSRRGENREVVKVFLDSAREAARLREPPEVFRPPRPG